MKKNVNNAVTTAKNNAKNVNNNVKSAKNELKNVLTSAFAGINFLNKVVSGKIGGGLLPSGMSVDNIKFVAAELKKIHGGRYAFTADVLTKDNKGRICTRERSRKMPVWDFQLVDIVSGKYEYLRPCSAGITIQKLFAVFADIVKADAAAKVAKAKADAATAKVAANKKQKRDVVFAVFGELANTFTDAQIEEKYNIIKAA
jgi:hypothetical protein